MFSLSSCELFHADAASGAADQQCPEVGEPPPDFLYRTKPHLELESALFSLWLMPSSATQLVLAWMWSSFSLSAEVMAQRCGYCCSVPSWAGQGCHCFPSRFLQPSLSTCWKQGEFLFFILPSFSIWGKEGKKSIRAGWVSSNYKPFALVASGAGSRVAVALNIENRWVIGGTGMCAVITLSKAIVFSLKNSHQSCPVIHQFKSIFKGTSARIKGL